VEPEQASSHIKKIAISFFLTFATVKIITNTLVTKVNTKNQSNPPLSGSRYGSGNWHSKPLIISHCPDSRPIHIFQTPSPSMSNCNTEKWHDPGNQILWPDATLRTAWETKIESFCDKLSCVAAGIIRVFLCSASILLRVGKIKF
jgi:hypothetical protein